MFTHVDKSIISKTKAIKLVIFDVDGVLTNGNICLDANGAEHKCFYVQDGLAMKHLQQTGVAVGIISSRESTAVTHRMRALGIQHVYQGQTDKKPAFIKLQTELNLKLEEMAYVGDDLPDLPLIKCAGLGIAVANAHPFVLRSATWCTHANGGAGAAREVCELIMYGQGTLETIYQRYL